MSLPKRIYAALRKHYPTESNTELAEIMGCGTYVISRLRSGQGIGVPVARWLAEQHGYTDLYAEAQARLVQVRKAAMLKRDGRIKAAKAVGIDLSSLPRHLQAFVGYAA